MYEYDIDLRIWVRVDFSDFKAFDFVEVDCGALDASLSALFLHIANGNRHVPCLIAVVLDVAVQDPLISTT